MPPPFLQRFATASVRQRASHAEITQLARAYGSHVFHAAYRVLGDAGQAEDVQQDVFLRLLQAPLPEVDSWPGWLRTTATRMAIDRLRRSYRWDRLLPRLRAADPAPVSTPDRDAERHERARRLRRGLAHLPKLQAQCFALRALDGADIDAIAARLGITPNHARVALHRATQRLERLLGIATPHTEETSR